MGQRSAKSRAALMDAAEELYAKEGLGAVSNRRIAEHAGASNHSAVAYHFGSREGLITALVERHYAQLRQYSERHLATLGDSPSLWDLVACRILPMVELMEAQPIPSWRARFLAQAVKDPELRDRIIKMISELGPINDVQNKYLSNIKEGNAQVMKARSGILGHMVSGLCAEYEEREEAGTHKGTWVDVGYFLVDATTGMLSAPVTRRDGQVIPTTGELFI